MAIVRKAMILTTTWTATRAIDDSDDDDEGCDGTDDEGCDNSGSDEVDMAENGCGTVAHICNEHGIIYVISSDFGDRMTTQSMRLMVLLSEHF